jgi:4-hydroxybenzoate polyprenyltransferase
MKQLKYYFLLMRPINLLGLALTMLLFRYAFVLPQGYEYYGFLPYLDQTGFFLLLITSLLVGASGYVVNDIFDVETDEINKPHNQIVEKHITEINAFNFYKLLVILSIIGTIALCFYEKEYKFSCIPLFVMAFLYMYAQQFKSQLIIGNIVIALCTALPVLLIAMYEFKINEYETATVMMITKGILYAAFVYAVFAFLSTWSREIIKDIQDMEGDKKIHCNTLPIKFGINKSKISIIIINLFIILLLCTFIPFYIDMKLDKNVWIHTLILIMPILLISIFTIAAKSNQHFKILSNAMKFYQLLGVLTMVYFLNGTGTYFFVQYFNFINKWM